MTMDEICPKCGKMNHRDFCWNCNAQLGSQSTLTGYSTEYSGDDQ